MCQECGLKLGGKPYTPEFLTDNNSTSIPAFASLFSFCGTLYLQNFYEPTEL